MTESDIKHENGHFWICSDNTAHYVMVNGVTRSKSESAYSPDNDGLSIAIARCNYLADRFPNGLSYTAFYNL